MLYLLAIGLTASLFFGGLALCVGGRRWYAGMAFADGLLATLGLGVLIRYTLVTHATPLSSLLGTLLGVATLVPLTLGMFCLARPAAGAAVYPAFLLGACVAPLSPLAAVLVGLSTFLLLYFVQVRLPLIFILSFVGTARIALALYPYLAQRLTNSLYILLAGGLPTALLFVVWQLYLEKRRPSLPPSGGARHRWPQSQDRKEIHEGNPFDPQRPDFFREP